MERYYGKINRLCMKAEKQPDGSVKKVVDEDMRQAIIAKLIESLPEFEIDM